MQYHCNFLKRRNIDKRHTKSQSRLFSFYSTLSFTPRNVILMKDHSQKTLDNVEKFKITKVFFLVPSIFFSHLLSEFKDHVFSKEAL